MSASKQKGFTILEILIVVVISGIIAISVSMFLQKSVSTFRRVDEEGELVGRVKNALTRLRRCIRHAISVPCNFQGLYASFEPTETLFFVTNMDQDNVPRREVHFVWFDRRDSTNTSGVNQLLHVWQQAEDMVLAQPAANQAAWRALKMPPDMANVGSPSFANLLTYLRDPTKFNANGPPTVREGWEILMDAPYGQQTSTNIPKGSLPVYLGRWTQPPGAGANAWPVVNGQMVPPSGICFNINNNLQVVPGVTATFSDPVINPVGATDSLFNQLCVAGTPPYPRLNGTAFGSPSVQVYINAFVDENQNGANDTEEPSVQLLTTLNMLLLPTAGTASP